MALCSLSTGRIATPFCRAASVTMPPAITSTSLLASAMVLPCSMAASTASRPSVPDEAQRTRSTSGCEATATRPSRPTPSSAPAVDPCCFSRSSAAPEAIAATRGRWRAICAAEQLGVLAGGEADDLQPVGVRVDHGQRAPADRSGRSEDGDAFHD